MFCSHFSLTWIIVVVPIDLTGSYIDVRCEQQHCEQRQIAAPHAARFMLLLLMVLAIGSCYVHCGSPQGIGSAGTPFSSGRVASSWLSLRFQRIHCVILDCNKPSCILFYIQSYIVCICVCLPRFFIGFPFAEVHQLTHTHTHTETRASICNAHNYSTTHVKTKVVVFFILFLLPRGAQCVVGDGLRLQLWLWLWPLQPQQPQLAFNIFLTLMKRNEQIFLRTFAALAPLSNTFRCCLSLSRSLLTRLVVRRFFRFSFSFYSFRFFRCNAQQLIKLFLSCTLLSWGITFMQLLPPRTPHHIEVCALRKLLHCSVAIVLVAASLPHCPQSHAAAHNPLLQLREKD